MSETRANGVEAIAEHLWTEHQADPDEYIYWKDVGRHMRSTYLDIAEDIVVALERKHIHLISQKELVSSPLNLSRLGPTYIGSRGEFNDAFMDPEWNKPHIVQEIRPTEEMIANSRLYKYALLTVLGLVAVLFLYALGYCIHWIFS